ncbi:MAG: hypothetical protein KC549_04350 [Myxococcales bacterium]|nr:hypothetical protein [Myxococcales bacterium]
MDAPAPDTLVDLLADLQHDLGKYLRLPLAWLPADAGDDDVREAAREALLATRRAGGRVHAAADIWQAFLADVQDDLAARAGWPPLVAAVARVLAWTPRLDGPLDRAALQADLAAVSPAIRALLDEVEA